MRIVFFGTPEVAVPSLQLLIDAGHHIPLVITQPDRPVGRSRTPRAPAVKRLAEEAGLLVEQPRKVRTRRFRERIADCEPDLLVVVAYGKILSTPLLEQTPHGAINLHFSLLPHHRGAAPVQWALARGESLTGVSTMCISDELDAGDTLLQQEVPIEAGEHAPALFDRLAHLGAPLLARTVSSWARGELTPQPQDHHAATFAPMLRREDGWIDPATHTAVSVEGRVRGFDPWPGVWLRRGDRRIRLVSAAASERSEAGDPGRVIENGRGGAALLCSGGSVLDLIELQPDGRVAMAVADALNGRQLVLGERLEPVDAP